MRKHWIALVIVFISVVSFASDDNTNNYEDYDSIVNSMSTTTAQPSVQNKSFDFNSLNFHFNFGYSNSLVNLRTEGNSPSQVSMGGVILGLGIDLFSPDYIAEISYDSSNPTDKDSYSYQMHEYDLRVYYHRGINSSLNGKAGAGIGARSLSVTNPNGTVDSYNSPVGQIFAGLELLLGKHLGFETDLTFKSALANNTPEKSSVDLGFGVNGHF